MAFNNEQAATKVYELVKQACDEFRLRYEAKDTSKRVNFDIDGDYEPVAFSISVNEKINVVFVLSDLSVQVDERYSEAVAQATNAVNCRLAYGSFDYNYQKGQITYRLPTNYTGMDMDIETAKQLILLTFACVNKYNKPLSQVAEGAVSFDEFCQMIGGN